MNNLRIGILGGGSWGTTVASLVARNAPTKMWARNQQTVDDINEMPENKLLGIGNNCFIQNVIFDKNVKIGNDVTLVGHHSLKDIETESYCIREGIIIVKRGGYIESGSKIGHFQ